MKTISVKKKKKRFNYYEDADVADFIDKLPFHNKSIFIREATRNKMNKESKK